MSASLDFFVFYLLNENTLIYYQIINILSISCGISMSFILNAKLNFKVHDNYLSRFMKFYSVGGLGIVISNLLLYILYEQMSVEVVPSKIITIFVVVIVQFTLNSKYSLAAKKCLKNQ